MGESLSPRWVPLPEASRHMGERHKGRPAEQERVLGTHRAGVLQGSRDDEPSQALTLHTGCDGHPADAHHLCLVGP
ncbi:hypothetical protein M2271_006160 [Streptomyces sp. LBL]|nr:hypothetical protein [Streptomyces sp. LBL]